MFSGAVPQPILNVWIFPSPYKLNSSLGESKKEEGERDRKQKSFCPDSLMGSEKSLFPFYIGIQSIRVYEEDQNLGDSLEGGRTWNNEKKTKVRGRERENVWFMMMWFSVLSFPDHSYKMSFISQCKMYLPSPSPSLTYWLKQRRNPFEGFL